MFERLARTSSLSPPSNRRQRQSDIFHRQLPSALCSFPYFCIRETSSVWCCITSGVLLRLGWPINLVSHGRSGIRPFPVPLVDSLRACCNEVERLLTPETRLLSLWIAPRSISRKLHRYSRCCCGLKIQTSGLKPSKHRFCKPVVFHAVVFKLEKCPS